MSKLYPLLFLMLMLISCKSDINIEDDEQPNMAIDFNFGNTALRNFHGVVFRIFNSNLME